jgi:hypothetical protein
MAITGTEDGRRVPMGLFRRGIFDRLGMHRNVLGAIKDQKIGR